MRLADFHDFSIAFPGALQAGSVDRERARDGKELRLEICWSRW